MYFIDRNNILFIQISIFMTCDMSFFFIFRRSIWGHDSSVDLNFLPWNFLLRFYDQIFGYEHYIVRSINTKYTWLLYISGNDTYTFEWTYLQVRTQSRRWDIWIDVRVVFVCLQSPQIVLIQIIQISKLNQLRAAKFRIFDSSCSLWL